MLSKAVTGLVSAGLLLAGQAAFADHVGKWHGNRSRARRHSDYDYARVVDVDPIVRHVRVTVPRRECWTETRYEEVQHGGVRPAPRLGRLDDPRRHHRCRDRQPDRPRRWAPRRDGRRCGDRLGHRPRRRGPPQRAQRAARCTRRAVRTTPSAAKCATRRRIEDRVEGYRVTYEYTGRRQTTQLPYDPGDRIRVRVDVQPED